MRRVIPIILAVLLFLIGCSNNMAEDEETVYDEKEVKSLIEDYYSEDDYAYPADDVNVINGKLTEGFYDESLLTKLYYVEVDLNTGDI